MKIEASSIDFADTLTNPKYLYCPNCDMQERGEIMVGSPTGDETEHYFRCPDCHSEFHQRDMIPGMGYLQVDEIETTMQASHSGSGSFDFEEFLRSDNDSSNHSSYYGSGEHKPSGKCVVCWDDLGVDYDDVCDMCAHEIEVKKRNEEVEEYWKQHFGPRDK